MDRFSVSLHQLARLYGVQTSYYNIAGLRRPGLPEAVLPVLRALGAPIETLDDVPTALKERRQALWQRCLEPVIVSWDGTLDGIELRLPAHQISGAVAYQLRLEDGDVQSWSCDLAQLPVVNTAEIEGARYVIKKLPLPGTQPWGYHQLAVEAQGRLWESMVISAPTKAYTPSSPGKNRAWGVFLPLYALHSQRSWGGGDLSDLETLWAWVAGLGGSVVGTLPLLASFLDEPFDPSPYAPVSHLFWNELYVDITRAPELERCPQAPGLLASVEFQKEIEALRSLTLVDYRRQMALKRRVLGELARCFFGETSARQAPFQRFVDTHPDVEDYARFRATCERQRTPWTEWPQRLRDGTLEPGDYDEEARRYHLYAQWLAHEQLQAISEKARQASQGLYLDLPLGVHPHGYDTWRSRGEFALGVSAGAPPDAFFTGGQNWGFSPLHPEAIRERGYRYYIAGLRNHLQHAGILRLDHVMGLHRLYWIPEGVEARHGVYVRYKAEEFYAILSLESHRHQAIIVGEDLGTVPGYVRPAMARHNMQRMYVLQYEINPEARPALRAALTNTVASTNTHDMPPFAALWQGTDIEDRLTLGLLKESNVQQERERRQALRLALAWFLEQKGWLKDASTDTLTILRACLAFMAAGTARFVLVNLEDLWLETQPQNIPSTLVGYPNWRRKTRYSLEEFCQMPHVLDTLKEIDRLRKRGYRRNDAERSRNKRTAGEL